MIVRGISRYVMTGAATSQVPKMSSLGGIHSTRAERVANAAMHSGKPDSVIYVSVREFINLNIGAVWYALPCDLRFSLSDGV